MGKDGIYLFEKNTDAVGTNRGLLYQYLITLNDWIQNYISKNDQEIFCEFEDDIKEVKTLSNEIVFKQVKNYDSPFNINSEEIVKSLYNFYTLYLKYKTKFKSEFYFITNTHISKNDTILTKWIERTDMELVKCEIIKILSNKILLEKNNKITLLDNRIKKYSKDSAKNLEKINKANEKKKQLEENALDFINEVKEDSDISEFIEHVFFEFKVQNCEDSIKYLKSEIFNNLNIIGKCAGMPNIYFSRFLSEVNQKSCISNTSDRILSIDLFEEILNETNEEIQKNTKDEFVEMVTKGFENINYKLDKVNKSNDDINNKLDIANDNISKLLKNKEINHKLLLPIYPDDRVNDIIKTDSNSSNLVGKIKKIGIDEENTRYLIEDAQSTRCRYLIYKEELRDNNLNEELGVLQALEGTLRKVCIKKVIKYTHKEDFDSRDFYSDLIGELKKITEENELFLDYKFQDDIIYGQMYEIAAQCPLSWHKNEAR